MALIGAALACSGWAWALMFKAGCTGDVKGGALGDPAAALAVEDSAFLLASLGVLLLTASTLYLARFTLAQRALIATAALLMGIVISTVLGIRVYVWGVQSCFTTP